MFAKDKISQSMIDAVNQVLEEEKKRMLLEPELDETGFHKAAHAAKRANQSHFEFQGKKYPVTAKSHKESIEITEDYDSKLSGIADKHGYTKKETPTGHTLTHPEHGTVEINHVGSYKIKKYGSHRQHGVGLNTLNGHLAHLNGTGDKEDAKKYVKSLTRPTSEAVEMDEASLKLPTATGTKVLGGSGYGSKKAHEVQHKNPFEKGPSKKDLKGIKAPTKKELKKIGEDSFANKLLTHIKENKATGTEPVFTDNNMGEEMSDAQMKKREKIVMSMKKGEAGFKQRYGKNWKNVMYATATKQAMKEDSSDTWNGSYDFVLNEKEEVEQIDEIDMQTIGTLATLGSAAYAMHHAYKDHKKYKARLQKNIEYSKKHPDGRLFKFDAKGRPVDEEVDLDEGDASYKKNPPRTKMSDVVDRKKTVKDLMKGRQYFGSGKMKEEVELDEEQLNEYRQIRHIEDKLTDAHKNYIAQSIVSYGTDDHPYPDKKTLSGFNLKYAHRCVKKAVADGHKHIQPTLDKLNSLNEAVEVINEDESLESIAKKHGMEYKKTTYGAGMKHKTKGEISINRYGEWHHYPAGSKSSKAHGYSDNKFSSLDKHLSSLKEAVGIEKDPDTDLLTVDMLRGRVRNSKFAKLNSFRSYKVDLKTSEREVKPTVIDQGDETKEKQKVSTNPGPVDIKLDDKLATPPHTYFSKDKQVKNEEVKPELKHIRSKESKERNKEIDKFSKKVVEDKEDVPFDKPYTKVKEPNVTDKSGATHTPMSRAKDLARKALKKVKNETMMGKISNRYEKE